MLKTLFTPLRARFDLSPRSPPSAPEPEPDDELAPEDFARDVLIELMRNSVENLKQADSRKAQIEVLLEIERILLQESQTKDVFRELDGFLVLISVLSNVQISGPVVEPEEQVLADVIECTRVVFVVVSEATNDHFQNAEYFRTYVGYHSLESAMDGLVSNPKTLDETLGFLLSFALCEFSASGIFCNLRPHDNIDELDTIFNDFGPKLANATIHHPGAVYLLWNFLPKSYASFKLFELLASINHRNRAILSVPEVVQPLLDHLSRVTEKREKTVVHKLSRKLLDMGASHTVARGMFQRAIKEDGGLDMELLELIRAGMKSRWLEHFSFCSSSELVYTQEGIKSLPVNGFTFMIWLWIEKFPQPNTSQLVFAARVSGMPGDLLSLRLHHDGKLELFSSGSKQSVEFTQARILRAKWTQIIIAHYPGKDRFSNPSIRLFIDGVLSDTVHWNYPKATPSAQAVLQYVIGDSSKDATMDWCFSSCYMIALPLADDIPRFIHHLGPRYFGSFQDPTLSKFLTYEASTSLNMFLANLQISASQRSPLPPTPLSASAKSPSVVMMTQVSSSIVKAVKDGIGLPESAIIFALSPLNCLASGFTNSVSALGGGGLAGGGNSVSGKSDLSSRREFVVKGDMYVMKAQCLDSALWREGGAAVALRLIQVAQTPHEISRALGVVTDGMKNSWQNSEDIERLRGYDILADILRSKAEMLNMTSFETLFEFLGLNFRSPDHSTIVNVVAYRALALDFELWSHTRKDIQRVHLEHFLTLLDGSRYRRFNIKQRFAKIGLVRRLLFVLQTDWYQADSLPSLMDALKSAAQALWTKDDAIKPLVSYLAANLQEGESGRLVGLCRRGISSFHYLSNRLQ